MDANNKLSKPGQAHLKPEENDRLRRKKERLTSDPIDFTRQQVTGSRSGLVPQLPEQAYYPGPGSTYSQETALQISRQRSSDKPSPSKSARDFTLTKRGRTDQTSEQDMETAIQHLEPLFEQARQAKQDIEKAEQAIGQIRLHGMNQFEQAQRYEEDTKKAGQEVETARRHWMYLLNQVKGGLHQALQAPQAEQAMDKTRQAMDKKTRQAMDKTTRDMGTTINDFNRLKQALKDQQRIKETIEDMEKAIKSMNRQLKQARQAKQGVEKTRQGLEDRFNQAPQDKYVMDKIIQGMETTIQGMETTRQHWMNRLEQALEDKHAMDTTIRVIDRIIEAMDQARPCLARQFNQAPQDNEAMDKTIRVIDRIMQDLEREVDEIRTSGKNWKKKVLLLFTGGTIGSVRLDDGTVVQPSVAKERGVKTENMQSLLLNEFKEQNPVEYLSTKFDTKDIMETLSEDITKRNMVDLITKIKKILNEVGENYDGFGVTHGSDTLVDTADGLALALKNYLKRPLFLVSSHKYLGHPEANGVQNLEGALKCISDKDFPPGVYITYHSNGETKVIYGPRALKCNNYTHEYESLSTDSEGNTIMCPLGIIKKNGDFEVLDKKLLRELKERSQDKTPNLLDSFGILNARIEVIEPWLGTNYDRKLDGVHAILHLAYHAGTIRTDGPDDENLLKFLEKCQDKGIPVYLLIYGKEGRDLYDSTDKYCAKRGIILLNLTPDMGRMKLEFGYSTLQHNPAKLYEFLFQSQVGEFVGPATLEKGGSPSEISAKKRRRYSI